MASPLRAARRPGWLPASLLGLLVAAAVGLAVAVAAPMTVGTGRPAARDAVHTTTASSRASGAGELRATLSRTTSRLATRLSTHPLPLLAALAGAVVLATVGLRGDHRAALSRVVRGCPPGMAHGRAPPVPAAY